MTLPWLADLRQRRAASLAYFDVFWLFAVLSLGLVLLVLLMKHSVAEARGARRGGVGDVLTACHSQTVDGIRSQKQIRSNSYAANGSIDPSRPCPERAKLPLSRILPPPSRPTQFHRRRNHTNQLRRNDPVD